MSTLPETTPTVWHQLATLLTPMLERAFAVRWDKAIAVKVRPIEGQPNCVLFGFALAKPGLLPTAIERDWFNGYVAGYQAAVNLGMSIATPEGTEQ